MLWMIKRRIRKKSIKNKIKNKWTNINKTNDDIINNKNNKPQQIEQNKISSNNKEQNQNATIKA